MEGRAINLPGVRAPNLRRARGEGQGRTRELGQEDRRADQTKHSGQSDPQIVRSW